MWWYIIGFVVVFCLVIFEYSYKDKKFGDDVEAIWFLAFMSWAGVSMLLASYLGDYLRSRKDKNENL